MSTEIVKCPVRGCRQKLDSDNIPIEYCEYQQGRCPMQKRAFDWNNKFDRFAAIVLVPIMIIIMATVLYVELF